MTANDLVFSPPVRSKPTSAVRRPGSVPNAVLPSRARLSFLILSPSSLLRPNQVLRHPYGQLSEAAPSRLEATQGSEAQVAPEGPRPSNGLGLVLRLWSAARLHGGPRAPRLFRDLHRTTPPVLATVAARCPERHRQCRGIRRDPRLPSVSERAVHGLPIRSDLGESHGPQSIRGSGQRCEPGRIGGNPEPHVEPAAASRYAAPVSGPVTDVAPFRRSVPAGIDIPVSRRTGDSRCG